MKKTITALIIGLVCVTNTTLVNAEDLLGVYQQAQKNDPTVLRSKALFNASKEGIDQARAVLLPEISASASYTMSKDQFIPTSDDGQSSNRTLTNKSDTLRYGLSLSMPLYNHST